MRHSSGYASVYRPPYAFCRRAEYRTFVPQPTTSPCKKDPACAPHFIHHRDHLGSDLRASWNLVLLSRSDCRFVSWVTGRGVPVFHFRTAPLHQRLSSC